MAAINYNLLFTAAKCIWTCEKANNFQFSCVSGQWLPRLDGYEADKVCFIEVAMSFVILSYCGCIDFWLML